MTATALEPWLVEAYRRTHYRVHDDPPYVLHVEERNPALAARLAASGFACAAFVTAWNPEGATLDDRSNQAAGDRLRAELIRRDLPTWPGRGTWPDDPGRGEDSVLVLGLDRDAARALGRRLRQNAILWCDADAMPQLELLR